MADKRDKTSDQFIRKGQKVSFRREVAGSHVTGKGEVTAQAPVGTQKLHIRVTESSNTLLVAVRGHLVVSDYTLL